MIARSDLLLLVLLAVVPVAGCGGPTDLELPAGEATIEGPIVARDVPLGIADDEVPTVHVKRDDDDSCGIIFAVEDFTVIARLTGGRALVPAVVEELEVGRRVRVWARGAIAESCPAQGRAEAVVLLPDGPHTQRGRVPPGRGSHP